MSVLPRVTLSLVLLGACGGPGSSIPDECNPLGVPDQCMMPWPSMAYIATDGATATGFRLAMPIEAMPANIDGDAVDPAPFNRWDGASTLGPILARFPGGVSAAGLPPHTDPDRSLAADSPILLIDLAASQRVPFFAEVDMNVDEPEQRTLIIRPLVRLHPGTRYGVAIRDTVQSAAGGVLPVSEGFAAIRDGGSLDHPRWGQTTAGFTALFAAIEGQGVTSDHLVLAWDFVTASNEVLRSDLTTMVTAGKAMIGDAGANVTFTVTEERPPLTSYKRYIGTFQSPSFLTNGEADTSVMRRDAAGVPQAMGLRNARFAAIIPSCVATQPLPRPTILFGHGLFGSAAGYLDDGLVLDLAEDFCFVIIAGDWLGLTERQIALAPLAANDVNKAFWISDKLEQAIVDFIALENVIRGPMRTSAQFMYMGSPVIDLTQLHYLGGSLGGIMGNTFLAYDETIRTGVLAVPGGNWSMLFERSAAWTLLQGAAQGSYPDLALGQLLIALMGMTLEPVDPLTTAALVPIAPGGAAAPRSVLLWEAIGDSLVTNIATEMVAREMGLTVTGPTVRTPWGLDVSTAPMQNGFTIVDEHPTPLPSTFNQPEDDNGTHSGCNRRGALLREAQRFLLQGNVLNQCAMGPTPVACDCATGACD